MDRVAAAHADVDSGASGLHGTTANLVSKEEMLSILAHSGLDSENPRVAAALEASAADTAPGTLKIADGSLLSKALGNRLAVPNWTSFTQTLKALYARCSRMATGSVDDSNPVLARQDPTLWGVSVCTVDGQRFGIGDCDVDVPINDCVMPFMYATAVETAGLAAVHRRVGVEPAGLTHNTVSLNADNLPHNPMIAAGALAAGATIKPAADSAERFKFLTERLKAYNGGRGLGFSQPMYLCDTEVSWQTAARVFLMEEMGVFDGLSVTSDEVLEFYLQCCAILGSTTDLATMGATLASGGTPVNSSSGPPELSPLTVKSALSLMFSCGLNNFSGEWAVRIGLPAKSSKSGVMLVVVPHVLSIAFLSPPLNSELIPYRAVEFTKLLVQQFALGIFEPKVHTTSPVHRGQGRTVRQLTYQLRTRGREALRKLARLHHVLKYIQTTYKPKPLRVVGSGGGRTARKIPIPSQPAPHFVHLSSFLGFLQSNGLHGVKSLHPLLKALLEEAQATNAQWITLPDVVFGNGEEDNLLVRALLGTLCVPDFEQFTTAMEACFDGAEGTPNPAAVDTDTVPIVLQEIKAILHNTGSFAVAVFTVDGQVVEIGDTEVAFPLLQAVEPFLYALAVQDNSKKEVDRWVGSTPVALPRDTFSMLDPVVPAAEATAAQAPSRRTSAPAPAFAMLVSPMGGSAPSSDFLPPDLAGATAGAPVPSLAFDMLGATRPGTSAAAPEMLPPSTPHPMPYNPFMDSGALVMCSLLGRGHAKKDARKFHDAGSRYKHVLSALTKLAGNGKIGFNNPVFLALKQLGLKSLGISHFMKGMGAYPPRTQPTDVAELYFQASSAEVTVGQLALMAATIANSGRCPTTGESCLRPSVCKNLLSVMYSSGMPALGGRWVFDIGVPATTSDNGVTMLVVPGVMGIAIHQPDVNRSMGLSPKTQAFCASLVRQFRLSLFDKLVYQDKDIAVSSKEHDKADVVEPDVISVAFFNLCVAAQTDDVDQASQLLETRGGSALATMADYDKRTALHIAACDGSESVAQLLLKFGACIDAKDRWNHSPLDEARRCSKAVLKVLVAASGRMDDFAEGKEEEEEEEEEDLVPTGLAAKVQAAAKSVSFG